MNQRHAPMYEYAGQVTERRRNLARMQRRFRFRMWVQSRSTQIGAALLAVCIVEAFLVYELLKSIRGF
jgi:hypothetical protein